jgi:hypothetical protein
MDAIAHEQKIELETQLKLLNEKRNQKTKSNMQ